MRKKMSIFTVTVDLSKIRRTEPFYYHVLVDSSKITVFIEFIELVRSMFKITDYIRFANESGYIHYLEDVKILSVLQEVQAEIYIPEEEEKERMELLIKTLKFYDKSQNFPKILLARLRINIDNNTGEIVDGKDKDENLENQNQPRQNNTQEKDVTSQIQHLEIEPKLPPKKINDQINDYQANNDIPKHLNISEVDNITHNLLHDIKKPTPQIRPTYNQNRRKNYDMKPFSLGAMVSALRSEASTSGEISKEEQNYNSHECGEENQSNLSSAVENEMEEDNEEETITDPDPTNRKRKRVRKHRSRKRKVDEVVENFPSTSNVIPNGSPSVNVPFKNKHVRFGNIIVNESSVMDFEDRFNKNDAQVFDYGPQAQANQLFLPQPEVKPSILGNTSLDSMFRHSYDVYINDGQKTVNVVRSKEAKDLSGLLSYKKNNPSPVAYKRFNGNGDANGDQPGSSAE